MNDFDPVEILLAEDSDADAEMTIRALQGKHLANRLVRVNDGAEALDFIFRRGAYADRPAGSCGSGSVRRGEASGSLVPVNRIPPNASTAGGRRCGP